jgi:heme O synthase-like polyprenyltransferase
MTTTLHTRPAALRLHQFFALTKPRVVSLIVFTAMIGMFLATSSSITASWSLSISSRRRPAWYPCTPT